MKMCDIAPAMQPNSYLTTSTTENIKTTKISTRLPESEK